jgi:hypothetical protein
MPRVPLLNQLTAPQREAARELLLGPLYRSGNTFQRTGGGRIVRLQPIRGLLELRLATFNPDTKAALASARLIEAGQRAQEAQQAGGAVA